MVSLLCKVDLKTMDEHIFLPQPMKIRKDEKISFEDRILFEKDTNTVLT